MIHPSHSKLPVQQIAAPDGQEPDRPWSPSQRVEPLASSLRNFYSDLVRFTNRKGLSGVLESPWFISVVLLFHKLYFLVHPSGLNTPPSKNRVFG
jgi:hypothetical protein